MRGKFRGLAAVAAAAAAVTFSAGAASASTSTTHLKPEFFTVSTSTSNQAGTVNMFGPVSGRNGTLGNNNSDTLALFQFGRGTVFVAHPATPNPTINWRACTASVTQVGNWRFIGGTGKYRGATGHGRFTLREFAVFQVKHHKCQAANPNANPVFFRLTVVGQGVAALPGRD